MAITQERILALVAIADELSRSLDALAFTVQCTREDMYNGVGTAEEHLQGLLETLDSATRIPREHVELITREKEHFRHAKMPNARNRIRMARKREEQYAARGFGPIEKRAVHHTPPLGYIKNDGWKDPRAGYLPTRRQDREAMRAQQSPKATDDNTYALSPEEMEALTREAEEAQKRLDEQTAKTAAPPTTPRPRTPGVILPGDNYETIVDKTGVVDELPEAEKPLEL